MPILDHLWIIPLLPLLGSAINGLLGGKWPNKIVNGVALGATGLSFAVALEAVREFTQLSPEQIPWVKQYFTWITAGTFRAGFDLQVDQLTVVMLMVVTGVGFLIHIYSTGYMAHEGGYYRFFSYLNLFMFFMLILVLAANYVLLFVGWEGVGLCSYLLVGFYFLRKSAADAGKKAFIVNRIGDFGFMLGMFLLFRTFGSLDFVTVFSKAYHRLRHRHLRGDHRPSPNRHQKSPGVFHRQPAWLHVPGLRRWSFFRRHLPFDDARVLQSASFPCRRQCHSRRGRRAGHAQDGRPQQENQVDLYHHANGHAGHLRCAAGLFTALLTAFYMFRLIFLTFFGKQRYDEHHVHVHESPWNMLGPLVILAVLSIFGGWFALPAFWGGPDYFANFLAPVFAGGESAATEAAAHALELPLAGVAVLTAIVGFGVAFWLYIRQPGKPEQLAKSMKPVYNTLLNKYYVDELYAAVVVKPLLWVSTNILWKFVDVEVVDGTVNGIATGASALGDKVRHAQSGNTRSYAVWVVIGAIVVIAVIFFWPSGKPVIGMVR
jgi:NADH:ubiquinone oxidoreductase subunit 5 (subunit L)/multisubunit Na+/H+ antiporter MnhA subunit